MSGDGSDEELDREQAEATARRIADRRAREIADETARRHDHLHLSAVLLHHKDVRRTSRGRSIDHLRCSNSSAGASNKIRGRIRSNGTRLSTP